MTYSLLCLFIAIVEYIHAKDEYHDRYTKKSTEEFTGLNFSKNLEELGSKTEAGFIIYKIMMVGLFIALSLVLASIAVIKLVGLTIIGLYLLYQLHHLYEWGEEEKKNHGMRTAVLFIPLILAWWYILLPDWITYLINLKHLL